MQLLDRAMMAPEGAASDAMCAAAPASLYLAVCQDTQHSRDALPLLSAISNLTGPLASPITLLPILSDVHMTRYLGLQMSTNAGQATCTLHLVEVVAGPSHW